MSKKLLASILVLVLVLGMLPTAALAAEGTGVSLAGSNVTALTGSLNGFTTQGAETMEVKVIPTETLAYSPYQAAAGGTNERDAGWYVGIRIIAPSSVTNENIANTYFKNNRDNKYKSFSSANDGQDENGNYYLNCWAGIKESEIDALMSGEDVERIWQFDWDGDGKGSNVVNTTVIDGDLPGLDQTVKVTFNLSNTTLKNGDVTVWPQAEVGGNKYTLKGAINAAQSGDTVKLLDNLNLATSNITITGKKITLDFNEKLLTLNGGAIIVGSGADVTMQNAGLPGEEESYGASGITRTDNKQPVEVSDGGKLTIASDMVVFSACDTTAIYIHGDGAVLDVNGHVGNVNAKWGYAISGNGLGANRGITVNINDGAVVRSANDSAIYFPNYTTLNVKGGMVYGHSGIYQKSGQLNISGGIIGAIGEQASYTPSSNGSNSTGDALIIDVCDYPGGAPQVAITGGTFVSDKADPIMVYVKQGATQEAPTGFITGGKFNRELPKVIDSETYPYLADGYTLIPPEEGETYYTVGVPSLKVDLPDVTDGTAIEVAITGEYRSKNDAEENEEVEVKGREIEFDLYTKKETVDGVTTTERNDSITDVTVNILPETVASLVATNDVNTVNIKTDVADVQLSAAALNKLGEATDTVKIVVTTNSETVSAPSEGEDGPVAKYQISITDADDNPLLPEGEANGNITITVPVPDGSTATEFWAYYVKAAKRVQEFKTTLIGEALTFVTNHLSNYDIYETQVGVEATEGTTVKVTLDLAGGSLGDLSNEMVVDKDASVDVLPTPTRSGYTFTGWVDENGDAVTTISGTATLTATWRANGGGGSVSGPGTSPVTVNKATNGKVEVNPQNAAVNATVTVTATPDKGYVVDTVKVVDKDGKTVTVTKGKDGKYTFKMPAGGATVTATFKKDDAAGMSFTDVKSGDWFFNAVKYAYDNKLMDGTSATTFNPSGTVSRVQVAQVIYNMNGRPSAAGLANPFSDVKPGQWYTDAVLWCSSKGYMSGYGDGKFGANDNVTREQLALVFMNVMGGSGRGSLSGFTDADQVDSWALAGVEWAVANGIISGKGNNMLDPRGTAMRSELAQILMKVGAKVS